MDVECIVVGAGVVGLAIGRALARSGREVLVLEGDTFTLTAADLASYNTAAEAWIADAGAYTVRVGASSLDIKQASTFQVPKEVIVEKSRRLLAPQGPITEMSAAK